MPVQWVISYLWWKNYNIESFALVLAYQNYEKIVIYRGKNTILHNEIKHRKLEEYLKSLVQPEIEQFEIEKQNRKNWK